MTMTWRLSTFWYFYLGGWGVFFPFYSLYLREDLGLRPGRVGVVMAAIPLMSLVGQPLWGQLADRTGRRRRALALITASTAFWTLLLGEPRSFAATLAATGLFALFATSVLPMATALSLAAISSARGPGDVGRFGFVRMWGTIGFLVSVLVFPHVLDAVRGRADLHWTGLGWIFPATASLMALASLSAGALPETREMSVRSVRGDVSRLLRHPPVVRLLALTFAAHLTMQGSINLFPIYVAERGGDATWVSRTWILMLLVEIPLLGFAGRTMRGLGARGLLTMGLSAEAVRWIVCASTADLRLVAAAQVLHGVGVAGVLVGAPLYLEQAVPERLRSTGQALNAAVGFGAAAVLSNLAFGALIERFGAPFPYALAGGGALLLALLVHPFLPVPRPPAT